jgi:spore coat polysaccharide biosynthesis protein SpsF
MKVATIIQARMGSSRLPGKVLKDLGGDSVLARVLHRLERAKLVGEIIVATTQNAEDDAIIAECKRLSIRFFRGEQDDVLDRYYLAAVEAKAEAIVRITSDCPLIEPEVTDKTIAAFLEKAPDYASNRLERTYPRGLDTEAMTVETLARAQHAASRPYERTHVTPYIYEHPEAFRLLSVKADSDYSDYRWTLDTPEDLYFIQTVYERFGNSDTFDWRDVITLLEREPWIVALNREVRQKHLHAC